MRIGTQTDMRHSHAPDSACTVGKLLPGYGMMSAKATSARPIHMRETPRIPTSDRKKKHCYMHACAAMRAPYLQDEITQTSVTCVPTP